MQMEKFLIPFKLLKIEESNISFQIKHFWIYHCLVSFCFISLFIFYNPNLKLTVLFCSVLNRCSCMQTAAKTLTCHFPICMEKVPHDVGLSVLNKFNKTRTSASFTNPFIFVPSSIKNWPITCQANNYFF